MSRIDYSKWEHIDDSSCDDDEEDQPQAPRVTKLEQPSRITTQSDGSILVQPQSTDASAEKVELQQPQISESPSNSAAAGIPSDWTDKGDHVVLEEDKELWWSQDRYSVTLRMVLPSVSRKLQVQVEGILPYSDRNMATGSQKAAIAGALRRQLYVVSGELPHPVHLAEDEEDVDWTVITGPRDRKYLVLVLYKATPMTGMFLWWKQPFTNCPERSLEDDEDVHSSSHKFQQAWKEAQEQFAESVKSRPKHKV